MSQLTQSIKPRNFQISNELEKIQEIGNKIVGNFKIDKNNEAAIINLIHYFNGTSLNTSKGLFVRGEIGTGKTLLMKIFKWYANIFMPDYCFRMISSRQIAEMFAIEGHKAMNDFTYNTQMHSSGGKQSNPAKICIDDIGTEQTKVKHFGTDANIINELLMTRYDIFTSTGTVTHMTTNLKLSELKEIYGDRVISRLVEMCNDIVIGGGDRRE